MLQNIISFLSNFKNILIYIINCISNFINKCNVLHVGLVKICCRLNVKELEDDLTTSKYVA
jgi:hypothetical protein